MSLSLRAALPGSSAIAALTSLPVCASRFCPRPPTLWQRWWARHEGIRLEDQWYCSLDCFQAGFFESLERAVFAQPRSMPRPNRLPLGLILLSQGEITNEQLHDALQQQRAAGAGRVGEWLVKLGAVTEEKVTAALAAQQGCPLLALSEPHPVPETMHWPDLLVERYLAVPVLYSQPRSVLYVGFRERVDHSFLLSLEQMLHCRTQPCILPPATYRRQLEILAFTLQSETILIRERQDGVSMTRTIGNYAEQVRAQRCRLTCCDDLLWIRLERAVGLPVDFLFRLPKIGVV